MSSGCGGFNSCCRALLLQLALKLSALQIKVGDFAKLLMSRHWSVNFLIDIFFSSALFYFSNPVFKCIYQFTGFIDNRHSKSLKVKESLLGSGKLWAGCFHRWGIPVICRTVRTFPPNVLYNVIHRWFFYTTALGRMTVTLHGWNSYSRG